jgi:hypothetical protein
MALTVAGLTDCFFAQNSAVPKIFLEKLPF